MGSNPTVHVFYGRDHDIATFADSVNGEPLVFYRDACTTQATDSDGRPLPDGWVLSLGDGDEWIIGAWDIDGVDVAVSKAGEYLQHRAGDDAN